MHWIYLFSQIYFMCSTEVCIPSETPCRKACFDGKVCGFFFLLQVKAFQKIGLVTLPVKWWTWTVFLSEREHAVSFPIGEMVFDLFLRFMPMSLPLNYCKPDWQLGYVHVKYMSCVLHLTLNLLLVCNPICMTFNLLFFPGIMAPFQSKEDIDGWAFNMFSIKASYRIFFKNILL